MSIALLVIDTQAALFDPAPRPADAEAVIARIDALAARARAAGAAVVFVQHEQAADSGGPLVHASPGWQLQSGLQVDEESDAFVRKTTPDAFLRTDLADKLLGCGATELVVCGYATEFCVDTTVRRAAALGFPVTLASDAHTTHDKPHAGADAIRAHHNATLPSLKSFGTPIRAVPAEAIDFVPAALSPVPQVLTK